jgi:hypothetical protein
MEKPSGFSPYCMYQRIRQPFSGETRSIFLRSFVMVAMVLHLVSRRGLGRRPRRSMSLL